MLDLLGQGQRAQEVGEVVGEGVKLEPHASICSMTLRTGTFMLRCDIPNQSGRIFSVPY